MPRRESLLARTDRMAGVSGLCWLVQCNIKLGYGRRRIIPDSPRLVPPEGLASARPLSYVTLH